MKKKPHEAWYLLPVGILFVAGIITIIFFYQAVINPLMNVNDATLNEVYDAELTKGSFVSLYFEDEDVNVYSFTEEEGDYFFQYETPAGTYSVQVEILRITGGAENSGFEVVAFEYAHAYTVDEYTNFADISIKEDGTYRVIYSSYDDINIDFALQFAEWNTNGVQIRVSFISLIIGLPASLISFIVIIRLRANSKNEEESPVEETDPNEIEKDSETINKE